MQALSPPDARARELARQQAFVAALLDEALRGEALTHEAAVHEQGERRRRGLSAYRANAASLAERALAATCPTVAALVGGENFAPLAWALWRASPPRRGDLAQWGHDLPEFIEALRDLDPWPYLGDVARLDLAVQACEAAPQAELDVASLGLLAEIDPALLGLRLHPALGLVEGRWAIASIRVAHAPGGTHDAEALRHAIDCGVAERVVVARPRWRAELNVVDAPAFAWMRALAQGLPLDQALDTAAQAGDFDLNTWLADALRNGWLWRAERHALPPTPTEEIPT